MLFRRYWQTAVFLATTIVGLISLTSCVSGISSNDQPAEDAQTSFDAPLGEYRTYYETLDLKTPESAVQTFVAAFQRQDYPTVWMIFSPLAQFRWSQNAHLLRYDQIVQTNQIPWQTMRDDMELFSSGWNIYSQEYSPTGSPADFFDDLMLAAEKHHAFLIDLRGEVTILGVTESIGEEEQPLADVRANVAGIEGEVVFRLQRIPSGRWRVRQVIVPGGDEDSIPWSTPATT